MRTTVLALSCLALAAIVAPWSHAADVQVDSALTAYEPVSGVSGNLNSIGSDTLNNLMTLWAEGFGKYYPSVHMQVEGKGSATAPPRREIAGGGRRRRESPANGQPIPPAGTYAGRWRR